MRNFQIRTSIFSLLVVLFVSIFLTSCEQQEVLPGTANPADFEINYTSQESNTKIMLPEDVTKEGPEAVAEYLKSISDEKKVEHINDYIIYDYFTNKGKLGERGLEAQNVGAYRDLDLSKHLSGEELQELNKSLISVSDLEISSRDWCSYDVYTYAYSYEEESYCWDKDSYKYYLCEITYVDVYEYSYTVFYLCESTYSS